MSSQDFPTYGRGDEPPEQPPHPAVPPAEPYGPTPVHGQPPPGWQPPEHRRPYPPPAGPQYGQRPDQQFGQQQHQPYGQQFGESPYGYPGQQPYGATGPQLRLAPGQQPYAVPTRTGRPIRSVDPNLRLARLALISSLVTAGYALLVLSVQRTALREIAQAPGSPLNDPLRTDVSDTIGQLAVIVLTGVVVTLWVRDLLARRSQGRSPVAYELIAFGMIGVAVVFVVVWFLMVASTGFGSLDESTDRLPTAYGYGGVGLLLLASGLFACYRAFRPDVATVIQQPMQRPPWE